MRIIPAFGWHLDLILRSYKVVCSRTRAKQVIVGEVDTLVGSRRITREPKSTLKSLELLSLSVSTWPIFYSYLFLTQVALSDIRPRIRQQLNAMGS